MSATFIVLTGSEKQDIIDPTICGPFPDAATAQAFCERYVEDDIERGLELSGGYAAAVLVHDKTAMSPEEYLAERYEEEGEEP